MRKQISVDAPTRSVRIGWVSFQPDGSISFGLNDRTYITPRFQDQDMIWNAYNRVGIQYVIASDPSALQPVRNPHFTYHPAAVFQLRDGNEPPDKFLFRGFADVGVTLMQDGVLPWIRAVSAPLSQLKVGKVGRRQDGIQVDEIAIVAGDNNLSVRVALDFIRPEDVRISFPNGEWDFVWHAVAVRLRVSVCLPQIATLSWFHFY